MTGKFGVGLSACLTYALLTSGVPMRIVSKTRVNDFGLAADFTIDSRGKPQALQERSGRFDGVFNGTIVRVQFPIDEFPRNTPARVGFTKRGKRFIFIHCFVNITVYQCVADCAAI